MVKFPTVKRVFKGVDVDYSSSALDLIPVSSGGTITLTLVEGSDVIDNGYMSLWIGKDAIVTIANPGTSSSQEHVFDDIVFESGREDTAGLFDMMPRMRIQGSLAYPDGISSLPSSEYSYHTVFALPFDIVGITDYTWVVKYPSSVSNIDMSELLAWIPSYASENIKVRVDAYFPQSSLPNVVGLASYVHCFVNPNILNEFSNQYGHLVAEVSTI